MADPLPKTGPSAALRNEGVSQRDVQNANRQNALAAAKFQEFLRIIESRTSQIQSPSNFVQQGIFNAFGNNVATQSVIQGAGLVKDLVLGTGSSPEETRHDETKELLKKANETLSLMDESISTIQTITKIILDNILDSTRSLRKIAEMNQEIIDMEKDPESIENDEPKRLTFEDGSNAIVIDPQEDSVETRSSQNLKQAALEYTPFTIEGESRVIDSSASDDTKREVRKPSFEIVKESSQEILDKFDPRKAALEYTPFTVEGQFKQIESIGDVSKQELGYENKRVDTDFIKFENTSDISKQEKIAEEDQFRKKLLAQNTGTPQQINALEKQQDPQQMGLGMLEAILGGAGALSLIKDLFGGAVSMLKSLGTVLKGALGFLSPALKGLGRLVLLLNPIALKIAAIAAVVGGAMYLIKKFAPSATSEDMKSTPSEFSGLEGTDVGSDSQVPIDKEKFFDRKDPEGPGMLERLFNPPKGKNDIKPTPDVEPMTPFDIFPVDEKPMQFNVQKNTPSKSMLDSAKPIPQQTGSVMAMKDAAIKNEMDRLTKTTPSSSAQGQTNIVNSTNVNNQTILPTRSVVRNTESSFNRYLDSSIK